MTTFNAGDTVLVYRDHHDKEPQQAVVTRTTSRTVTLDNGRKFTADGREWGNSDAWQHRSIKLAPKAEEAPATIPAPLREIEYDQESKDYRMMLDGQCVGYARTYGEARITLDQLALELIESGLTRTATELDGGDTEAVTLPEAIALQLTGTANPVCELCGAPAFVSSSGHLYCKSMWQFGSCDSTTPAPRIDLECTSDYRNCEDIPSVLDWKPGAIICSCGATATQEVKVGLMLHHLCGGCYQTNFVNNESLLAAWEATELPSPTTCRNCAGPPSSGRCSFCRIGPMSLPDKVLISACEARCQEAVDEPQVTDYAGAQVPILSVLKVTASPAITVKTILCAPDGTGFYISASRWNDATAAFRNRRTMKPGFDDWRFIGTPSWHADEKNKTIYEELDRRVGLTGWHPGEFSEIDLLIPTARVNSAPPLSPTEALRLALNKGVFGLETKAILQAALNAADEEALTRIEQLTAARTQVAINLEMRTIEASVFGLPF